MLRWGVVGIGGFVEGTMAPAITEAPNNELVAVVSRDAGRASDFAARWGVDYSYTNYDEMLANPAVDVVYVATPNSLHATQVAAAAEAGRHVFCEKPLANNVDDALRAYRACEDAGVRLGIDFHNRFVPWVQDVAAMVSRGDIGAVEVIEVDVGSGPRHYENWRADPLLAGLGSVHNVGVHALDFLRVVLAADVVEVAAMFDRAPNSDSVEMLALILLRFGNGTLVYCNCNESLADPTNAITIHGTKGRIRGTGFTRSRIGGDLTVRLGDGEVTTHYPASEAHRMCLAAFTEAVLADRDPIPSGADGLVSARVCEAITRSAAERRIVSVDYDGKPSK